MKTAQSLTFIVSIFALIISIYSLFSLNYQKNISLAPIPEQHELIQWAQDLYPLGREHVYIISRNQEIRNPDDSIQVPEDIFYVITPHSNNQNSTSSAILSGRRIGSTDIDLSTFENETVTIDGYFYLGSPMFIVSEEKIPLSIRSNNQAVLHISSLYIAE